MSLYALDVNHQLAWEKHRRLCRDADTLRALTRRTIDRPQRWPDRSLHGWLRDLWTRIGAMWRTRPARELP